MDHQVRNVRQLTRGFEAEVTLGVGSVPSANITMKVTIGPLDEELREIQRALSELFARRATEHIQNVVSYDAERGKRAATAARAANAARAEAS